MATTTMRTTQRVSPAERAATRREVAGLFAKYDTRRDGFIDQEELAPLMRDLCGRPVTKNEVLFALRAIDLSDDGRISQNELAKYWESARVGHHGTRFNKLLVKDLVGAVRTSTYDLPPTEHAFGATKPAAETHGTREVLTSWQASKGGGRRVTRPKNPDHSSETHGQKGRPSTPIGELIKCSFAGKAATAKDTNYPALPKRSKPSDAPPPRTTAATEYRMMVTRERKEADEVSPSRGTWKMKKFSKVKATFTLPGSHH